MLFQATLLVASIAAAPMYGPVAQNQMVPTDSMRGQMLAYNTVTITPTYGGGYTAYGSNGQTSTYVPTYGGGGTVYGSGGTTTIVPTYGGGYTAYGPNGHSEQYVPTYGGGGTIYRR